MVQCSILNVTKYYKENQKLYDVAIIGAGINGCATAYFLTQAKKRVALIDKEMIAAGGSGAAGAFISPKFSKGGELKELMEEAYPFALDFYSKNFPSCLKTAPLLHIARDEKESVKLHFYKETTTLETLPIPLHVKQILRSNAQHSQSIFLRQSGVVDAQNVCKALAKDADFYCLDLKELHFADGYYTIGDIQAKEVVLAYGAYMPLIDEPYIKLRGIWGHRIDIKTTTRTDINIHHHVSISKCEDGNMAIGATHNVHYHPQKNLEPYDIDAGRKELLEKASLTLKLGDVEIIKDYMGLRCGSNDYIPHIGRIVESQKSDDKEITYYPNLSMINGVGGYGFVLAPLIAKKLSEMLVYGKPIDSVLALERFYHRMMRRI